MTNDQNTTKQRTLSATLTRDIMITLNYRELNSVEQSLLRDTRKALSFTLLHRLFHRKEDNRMKPWAERFYNSDAWRSCRDSFLKSRGYLCERCSTPDDPVTAKIAHHKTYLTEQNINDPYIALSWDNLEALCQDCHNKEHHESKRKKRYSFDENGNVVLPPIRRRFREGSTPRAGG